MPTPNQRPAKHGRNKLSNYLTVHETVLNQFRDSGFIGEHCFEVLPFNDLLLLQGWIGCQGKIVVDYHKTLLVVGEIEGQPLVETQSYAYNAHIQNGRNILRYDNSEHHGHPDGHHKHLFNITSGDELTSSPVWIGVEQWPTLGEVIDELRGWHSDHYSEIPSPTEYPNQPDQPWCGFGFTE